MIITNDKMTRYHGIDASEINGAIDWAAVKAEGVDFAILRMGYGTRHEDKRLAENYAGARAQGIKVGFYWFSYAISEAEAKAEAEFCVELLAKYKPDLAVWFDWEYASRDYAERHGVTISDSLLRRMTDIWMDIVAAAGYQIGVYANLDYINNHYGLSYIKAQPLWLAQYDGSVKTDCAMLQYGQGTVAGKKLDLNYAAELPGDEPVKVYPNDKCTRAELVTMLWRAAGSPEAAKQEISDVPEGHWSRAAFDWAVKNGIVAGKG